MKDIKIKYTSPAIPPVGININTIYTIGYIKNNYDINDKMLKAMFTPIDDGWNELEKKNKKMDIKVKYKNKVGKDVEEIDGAED